MTTRTYYESGSAHAVIVLLVVVGLIAGLVFTFVQRANQQPSTSTPAPTQSVGEPDETKEYCLKNEELCFVYPSNWSVQASSVDNDMSVAKNDMRDEVTIIDDARNPILYLSSGLTQLEADCDPEDEPMVTIIDAKPVKITGDYLIAAGAESRMVRTVHAVRYYKPVDKGDDKFEIGMTLTNRTALTKPGSVNVCDFGLNTIKGRLIADDAASELSFSSNPFQSRRDKERATYSSAATASDALKSDRMNRAFEIMQSVSYKQQ